MMTSNKVIFWDFDGTLGYRPGGMWGASMIEALKRHDPCTRLIASDFREFLISGFPWHNPERPHTFRNADEWWQPIIERFMAGFIHYGIGEETAIKLAHETKNIFLDLKRWALFDDTEETLLALKVLGWKHGVISNHVPELENILDFLGLTKHFDLIINSALIGYEKPNKEILRIALEQAKYPDDVWMVGDNLEADIHGAVKVGIKSILVRNVDSRARFNCEGLKEVINIVER